VGLPFEVENVIFFKPIWSDGWETLFSKLNTQSEVNGGTVPKNAVHQMFLYLRVMLVSIDKAIQGSNKMADQFNISQLLWEVSVSGNVPAAISLRGGQDG
jgi:hypothetical protein